MKIGFSFQSPQLNLPHLCHWYVTHLKVSTSCKMDNLLVSAIPGLDLEMVNSLDLTMSATLLSDLNIFIMTIEGYICDFIIYTNPKDKRIQ